MSAQKALVTADDLLRLPRGRKRYELVRGEVFEMTPAGARHGRIAGRVYLRIASHVEGRGLGEVFGAETGFRLAKDPDTVRAPDVAFVKKERLAPGELSEGYLELAPDLAVEVVSPGDAAPEVQAKVEGWLEAGVREVWVVYPRTRSVTVFRSLKDVRVLTGGDELEGGAVLPGLRCPVKEIF